MVFKNFKLQVVLRTIILTAIIALLCWCLVHGLYLRSIYLAVAAIISLLEFFWYVDRFNRDIKSFLISLMQQDFTTRYQSKGKGKSFEALYEVLNQISAVFKKISTEKEIQHHYLEMLVEHVRVGILSIDSNEKIQLANQAVKDLLQKEVLSSIKSLESFGDDLTETIREIKTGETRLVKLSVNSDSLQLSVHASELKLEGRYHKLISMQNIRTELDAREMEAWQKLIRVLSHEIMNSVSPIISLSQTLHELVTQNNSAMKRYEPDKYNALDKGLEAIKIRGEGLFSFTKSYRKLTGLPKLSLSQVDLKTLIDRVKTLMQSKLDERNIKLIVSNTDTHIVADTSLMEHVLINLLLNAMDALQGKKDGWIHIQTTRNAKNEVCVHVADNGEGMDDSVAEKIFIPFFTTRKNGSGIGLAITRQILQLHGADIKLRTERGKGTEFIVVFSAPLAKGIV